MTLQTDIKKAAVLLIVLLSLASFCGLGRLQAANLHLVMVGDLEAVDLKDAIKLDLGGMHREAQKIASYTKLKLKENIFSGSKARANEVLDFLKNVQAEKEDVMIFYFTGHGYRTPSKGENPWPNLYFSKENKGVDLSTVMEILDQKPAHLILLITDCCNSFVPDNVAPPLAKHVVHGFEIKHLIKENYRKLFLETNGFIAISSSEAGQTSLATNMGSFYTMAFLESLGNEVRSPTESVEWQSIIDKASYHVSHLAQEYDEEQNPIFTVMLRN